MRKIKEENKLSNKPAPKLLEILEINRLFPVNSPLPLGEEILKKSLYERKGEAFAEFIAQDVVKDFDDYFQENQKLIEKEAWNQIVTFSVKYNYEKVISYILEIFPSEKKYGAIDWVKKYDELRTMHIALNRVAESAKDLGHFGKTRIHWTREYRPVTLTIIVGLDVKGGMDFLTNPVAEALQGADPERLQICPVCKYVFWAFRLNQKWCSKKCADVHAQRERRANECKREEINKQRRQNYAYNKAVSRKHNKTANSE